MAKVKTSKGAVGVTNRALHSRVSFLYQAATYLATQEPQTLEHKVLCTDADQHGGKASYIAYQNDRRLPSHELARRCISDLRSVSLKTQIRLSTSMKHSICKRCDTMLLDGYTCESEIENKSKNGKKPWANVLVRRCKSCGNERRFPCETNRQTRRPFRTSKLEDAVIEGKEPP